MQEILTALTTAAGTGGICFLIFKLWFEKACAKQLETHKSKLSRDNELEIALFKHKLELAAAERNFRFSHVFEKTAEAIVNTYRHLGEMNESVKDYPESLGLVDETKTSGLRNISEEKCREFLNCFKRDRIFIPKTTAKRILDFTSKLSTVQRRQGWLDSFKRSPNANYEVVEEQSAKIGGQQHEIQELLTALQDEFQKILGFPMEDKPPK
jgi:hypothetical protein